MKRDLICICCPLGCALEVDIQGDNMVVSGNTCKKGEEYGIKECKSPTRIVTTSVPIENGTIDMLPVKTESDIPKEKIFDCIKQLKNVKATAPVEIGDIILANVCNTGVNIIATKRVE